MTILNRLWEKTLPALEEEMDDFQFNVWIKELKPVHEDHHTFYFEVSSPLHKTMMKEKYEPVMRLAMDAIYQEMSGSSLSDLKLEFITSQEASNIIVSDIQPQPQAALPKKMGSSLNPNYTFDTFVVGESNKFANAAALAVAQSPGHSYNPLYLYGGVGLGKTHLMHAVGNYILKEKPDAEIVYVTSETFTNELIRMIQMTNNNSNIDLREQFRNKYRKVDVLMVDDIQFIAGKDVTQDEFFHTFNALHELNKQIIISSDRPPKEMEKLEERMRSRFEWGLIADIKNPDYETRVAILMKKYQLLRSQNPEIPPIADDVFHFTAQQPNTNIRTLEGALQKIIMYAELHKKFSNITKIDIDLAKKALEDFFQLPEVKTITPDLVVEVVAQYYDIKASDIMGSKKNRSIAFPRQICMFILRDNTGFTYGKIADFFKKKDHSTIIYAEDKIRTMIKTDVSVQRAVEDIIEKLQG